MSRPLLLDLFCGAGGAAMGYSRAGFDVVGVDVKPQPHYPFDCIEADALECLFPVIADGHLWKWEPAAIHASPPCQAYSTYQPLNGRQYPDYVAPVRELLRRSGLPYVIENVVGAPLINPVRVCGSALGLAVRRHRLFESNRALMVPPCAHGWQPEPIDVTGGGPSYAPRLDGRGGRSRKPVSVAEAGAAMGIDWMTRAELNEAIPPIYTEVIGAQIFQSIEGVNAY